MGIFVVFCLVVSRIMPTFALANKEVKQLKNKQQL